MIKNFTYFLSHSKKLSKLKQEEGQLLFEPSDRSVKTILDFAKAYHPAKLKNCEENDIILN